MLYYCFTTALLLLYYCFTTALLLIYYCFTTAGDVSQHRRSVWCLWLRVSLHLLPLPPYFASGVLSLSLYILHILSGCVSVYICSLFRPTMHQVLCFCLSTYTGCVSVYIYSLFRPTMHQVCCLCLSTYYIYSTMHQVCCLCLSTYTGCVSVYIYSLFRPTMHQVCCLCLSTYYIYSTMHQVCCLCLSTYTRCVSVYIYSLFRPTMHQVCCLCLSTYYIYSLAACLSYLYIRHSKKYIYIYPPYLLEYKCPHATSIYLFSIFSPSMHQGVCIQFDTVHTYIHSFFKWKRWRMSFIHEFINCIRETRRRGGDVC
jgi:hypothetical protein